MEDQTQRKKRGLQGKQRRSKQSKRQGRPSMGQPEHLLEHLLERPVGELGRSTVRLPGHAYRSEAQPQVSLRTAHSPMRAWLGRKWDISVGVADAAKGGRCAAERANWVETAQAPPARALADLAL